MRLVLAVLLAAGLATKAAHAQNFQTVVSVDSRLGYSTNSYLNPFLSEWNSAQESAYNLTSAIMQSYWYKDEHSFSLTGGGLFEPIFGQNENWKGGLLTADYTYRSSGSWSAGMEAGASYFSGAYSRSLLWIQPKITWFATPFTLFRLKAGSNFRNYQNYTSGGAGSNRFDLYGLEFETWPDYQWQLSAGLYGSLDTLPNIQEGFNARLGAGYYFSNGATISVNTGLEQFQSVFEQEEAGGGGPPTPGPGGPPNTEPSIVTVTNTDRIFSLGVEGSYPLNEQITVFASTRAMRLDSESSNQAVNDYELSAGIRLSLEPKFGKQRSLVNPEWEMGGGTQEINIQYSGQGRLYLVGDFNNWNRNSLALREQSDNTYVARLSLSPGAYEYKLLRVQGNTEEWLDFSDNVYTVSDGYGSENAMLLVE